MTHRPDARSAEIAYAQNARRAQVRSNLYGLLAFAFFDPSQELAQQLVDGLFIADLWDYCQELINAGGPPLQMLQPLQQTLSETSPHELLHALKVEYAHLFIGPGKAVVPPYETFYGQRSKESQPLMMVSPEAIAVERAYREGGVAVTNRLSEPPDHFATECEFLCYLCNKEAAAWDEADERAANRWRRLQAAFLGKHLALWGVEFCRLVEAESRQPFYQAMARFAAAFIRQDASQATSHGEDEIQAALTSGSNHRGGVA